MLYTMSEMNNHDSEAYLFQRELQKTVINYENANMELDIYKNQNWPIIPREVMTVRSVESPAENSNLEVKILLPLLIAAVIAAIIIVFLCRRCRKHSSVPGRVLAPPRPGSYPHQQYAAATVVTMYPESHSAPVVTASPATGYPDATPYSTKRAPYPTGAYPNVSPYPSAGAPHNTGAAHYPPRGVPYPAGAAPQRTGGSQFAATAPTADALALPPSYDRR